MPKRYRRLACRRIVRHRQIGQIGHANRRRIILARHHAQPLNKCCAGGKAMFRALSKNAAKHHIQLGRLARVDRRGRGWGLLSVRNDQLRGGTGKRHGTGNNFIGGNTQ
jgi:hypothetical protein